jgi:signal transduction histidine kinase
MPGTTAKTTISSGILERMDYHLASYSKLRLTFLLFALQILLFYGDYRTGPWVPFAVFYLITLYFSVKYLEIQTAYVMAFIIVLVKNYIKFSLIPEIVPWWQIVWQFITSYSIYTLFCYLINSQLKARRLAENSAALAINRAGEAERKLLNISEETQQRIGRELHDDLGQHLTGIAFMSQVLSQKLNDVGRDEMLEADRITQMLNQAISKTRNLAQGLCPEEIKEQGFCHMIEKFAKHVEGMYSVNCTFSVAKDFRIDDQEVAIHLFRITQEAINNAIKHGHATRIRLRLFQMNFSQKMEILDNGSGINTNKIVPGEGLGMRSMHYRADLIGATLNISPHQEGGTQVLISIPINSQNLRKKNEIHHG